MDTEAHELQGHELKGKSILGSGTSTYIAVYWLRHTDSMEEVFDLKASLILYVTLLVIGADL